MEVASRAHVAQRVISTYESDRREPALSTLTKLIEAAGHRLVVRTDGSDIDLMVDLAPGAGSVSLAAVERELTAVLRAPVDGQ
jgi:transcriptional regulator with XRE-family HTH domain